MESVVPTPSVGVLRTPVRTPFASCVSQIVQKLVYSRRYTGYHRRSQSLAQKLSRPTAASVYGPFNPKNSAYVNRFQKPLDHEQPAHWRFPRNHVRYNLQEWFSFEKLLDKSEARNQIGKRVKRRICRPEQSRLGGQPNDRFIPEAVARRMFASLTLSSRRLS